MKRRYRARRRFLEITSSIKGGVARVNARVMFVYGGSLMVSYFNWYRSNIASTDLCVN
ncbi:hypothetical protein pesp034 [Peridroma alphabaculovirus]|uniref:Uncharacterized protein n=1 Tax=Peridroma alphabaculovirus TaxID=1346829 RepID=A0A068LRE1_9ABAC|nr:hypothetical protein pesp034 [Peridroma alphabaculovirus]AIE47765.1 hypothetical protein pesp034 [Peridroma alphabaculovirus]